MKKKPDSNSPFPLEDLFPGLHKLRPDIARREAEDFLEFGAKQFDGFDLSDPDTRAQLLDVPAKEFIDFQPKLTPALQERLAKLPEDWDKHPECERPESHALAYGIAAAIEAAIDLPPHLCCILEGRNVRIILREP